MDEVRLGVLLAHGPRLRTLLELTAPDMNTAHGYCLMQALHPQLSIARMLMNARQLDTKRQGLVLQICRRFLHPEMFPLWPARDLLKKSETSLSAVRLVTCMPRSSQAALLPTLARLSCNAAVDIMYDLSEIPAYAQRVASAVAQSAYQPYMRMLGRPTLWHLVRYLRKHNSCFALARLLRDNAARAIRRGVVTHLIGARKYQHAGVPSRGTCLHADIHRMYVSGAVGDLERAMRYEPEAVRSLIATWPRLAREVKWLRRRIFMMSTQAYCTGAAPLWHGLAAATADILPMVVAYL